MTPKRVLFVCVQNSCRSQMAEGMARTLGKGSVDPSSAGSRPAGYVDPEAVRVMKEIGIDISAQRSKGFEDFKDGKLDIVVTLGCGDICPFVPSGSHIVWQIPDPKGKRVEIFRQTRDLLEAHIRQLLQEINAETSCK